MALAGDGSARTSAIDQATSSAHSSPPTLVHLSETDRQTAETPASRVASVEAQEDPPTLNLHQPEHKGLTLYLATLDEVRTMADLNSKAVALGAQEPEVEKAIKQAFAAARVAPVFVGDNETDATAATDALVRLAAREVAAAPFLTSRETTGSLAEAAAMLSELGLRLLEVPLDLPSPQ